MAKGFMKEGPEKQLERLIHAELKSLPELEAPATLLPRVMRRVREEEQLEATIHQRLRALPDLEAPATLVTRVLRAIATREQRVWWQRPWGTWPISDQILASVVALACFGFLFGAIAEIHSSFNLGDGLKVVQGWMSALQPIREAGSALVGALLLILNKLGPMAITVGVGVFLMMYCACIGLGTACVRLAIGRN